ncbi:MAG: hypothetical protein V1678_01300 [Candidatus Aenigmatarchaeota archaeon]
MESGTSALLYTLLFIGFMVALGYVYLAVYDPKFFGQAVAIWLIVIIVVFVTVVMEVVSGSEK